jgi:hypothetical protein
MARIYNFMTGPITVAPGLEFFTSGSITITQGQRSDSLEWSAANTLTIWDEHKDPVCTFNFGSHAQIQGGNYAVIQPGSFIVYDSNHDAIATGKGGSV